MTDKSTPLIIPNHQIDIQNDLSSIYSFTNKSPAPRSSKNELIAPDMKPLDTQLLVIDVNLNISSPNNVKKPEVMEKEAPKKVDASGSGETPNDINKRLSCISLISESVLSPTSKVCRRRSRAERSSNKGKLSPNQNNPIE